MFKLSQTWSLRLQSYLNEYQRQNEKKLKEPRSYICKNNKSFDIYRMQNQDFIVNDSKKHFG